MPRRRQGISDRRLLLKQVDLETLGGEIVAPKDRGFSTSPRYGTGTDGQRYVLKGFGDPIIVRAETAAYAIASELQIPVPDYALIRDTGNHQLLFGSRFIEHLFRDIRPFIKSPERIQNWEILSRIIILDIWLVNWDRNIYNLLIKPVGKGQVELVAIDFENAVTLRSSSPAVEADRRQTSTLWPSDELGKLLEPTSLTLDRDFIAAITAFSKSHLSSTLLAVAAAVGTHQDWAGRAEHALRTRASKLNALADEVWP